jgi:hypothetical protein
MTKSLVVAIEPDRNQAARLSGIVRSRLGAELVLADTAARALATLGDRVPDLILTPALLPARDEAALAGRLRDLGSAAAHVQTVTLPQLGGAIPDQSPRGMFERFRRSRPAPAATDGCDPEVFAQQVSAYLQRAQAERLSAPTASGSEPAEDDLMTAFDQAFMSVLERAPVPVQESTAIAVDTFEQPIEETAAAVPTFEAIEQELPTDAHVEPVRFDDPVEAVSEPVEVIPEPIAAMAAVPETVAAPSDDAVLLPPIVETFVAPVPIVEHVVEPPPLVDALAESPAVADAFFAPALAVDEFSESPCVGAEMFDASAAADDVWIEPEQMVDAFVALPPIVEEMVEPEHIVEKMIEPARIVDEMMEPEPVETPRAAAAPSDPAFSVNDIDLELWTADEPEPIPVETAVVAQPQPDEVRIDTAPPDNNDIDISSFLEGLVLPPAESEPPSAPAPAKPPVAAAQASPRPTPIAGARRPQPKRSLSVHEYAALEPKPARRSANPPIQDEWGLFDPQQCGFAALVAKLESVTEDEDVERQRGTSARLVSYN